MLSIVFSNVEHMYTIDYPQVKLERRTAATQYVQVVLEKDSAGAKVITLPKFFCHLLQTKEGFLLIFHTTKV